MRLRIAGVDFQGLMKNFNATSVVPQVAQGAACVAQNLGAAVIQLDCMAGCVQRFACPTCLVRQVSYVHGQGGQQSVMGMPQTKCRVESDTLLKLQPRLGHSLPPPTLKRNRANRLVVMGPGTLILRALTANVGNFGTSEFGFKFRNNPARNVFLQIDSFITTSIEATAPQDESRCSIDQLRRNPKRIAVQTHATLDHKTNAELQGDFRDGDMVTTKGERGRARNKQKAWDARQQRDDVFSQAVGKKVDLWIIRQDVERQYSNRGLGDSDCSGQRHLALW